MIEHVIRISFVYMGNSSSTVACASLSNLPWMTFLIQSFQGAVRRRCLFHRQSFRSLLMCTLWLVESDATACRLLKKMHCPKSTGCVYILKHIFPALSQLRGCVSFSHKSHAIIHAKHKLQDIVDERLPLKEFRFCVTCWKYGILNHSSYFNSHWVRKCHLLRTPYSFFEAIQSACPFGNVTVLTLAPKEHGMKESGHNSSCLSAIKSEAIGGCQLGKWSSLLYIMAFATMTRRPIFTIYSKYLLQGKVKPPTGMSNKVAD